jgi:hypothetical protein
MCQASAGATVKHQPESVSWINRNCVKDQVTPERKASPETRQDLVPPGGIEPPTHGLGNRGSIKYDHVSSFHEPLAALLGSLEPGLGPRPEGYARAVSPSLVRVRDGQSETFWNAVSSLYFATLGSGLVDGTAIPAGNIPIPNLALADVDEQGSATRSALIDDPSLPGPSQRPMQELHTRPRCLRHDAKPLSLPRLPSWLTAIWHWRAFLSGRAG